MSLGRNSDDSFTVLHETNDGRSGSHTFCVFDDLRDLAFHDRNTGVGCAEVDTDNLVRDVGGARVEERREGDYNLKEEELTGRVLLGARVLRNDLNILDICINL